MGKGIHDSVLEKKCGAKRQYRIEGVHTKPIVGREYACAL
jgi:hypothetical protein